jgi:hypothetical protein
MTRFAIGASGAPLDNTRTRRCARRKCSVPPLSRCTWSFVPAAPLSWHSVPFSLRSPQPARTRPRQRPRLEIPFVMMPAVWAEAPVPRPSVVVWVAVRAPTPWLVSAAARAPDRRCHRATSCPSARIPDRRAARAGLDLTRSQQPVTAHHGWPQPPGRRPPTGELRRSAAVAAGHDRCGSRDSRPLRAASVRPVRAARRR